MVKLSRLGIKGFVLGFRELLYEFGFAVVASVGVGIVAEIVVLSFQLSCSICQS